LELKFKGEEFKAVSDITKGRTMTHIRVENVAYQKSSAPDRAKNIFYVAKKLMKSVLYMNHRNGTET
jgi:hypothetical protein